MEQSQEWSSVEATEISAGCKQREYTETAAQHDASSSAERSAEDMTLATKSKAKAPPERSAETSSPPVKLFPTPFTGKVKSSVRDRRITRDSMLEQTSLPKPKETPVTAVPMKGIPIKSCSNEDSGEIYPEKTSEFCKKKNLQKHQSRSRLENGTGDIFLVWSIHTSKGSIEISSRVVKIIGHSPELHESDRAIPWRTLMFQCKGFERIANRTLYG